MSLKIVIPSHKRADRVLTKKIVSDPILCVAESQKEEYRRYNPECEIVTHPDDIIGLIPKRNWMAKHFQDLFMLDDDITAFKENFGFPTYKYIKDPKKAREKIEDLYELSKLLDCHLFGFNSCPNPLMYREGLMLSLSRSVTGCSYGVRYNENIWWNESLKLKEDYWISCYVKFKERKILTDNRYTFIQKETMLSSGGLASIRSKDEERNSVILLRRYFGECVQKKGKKTITLFGKTYPVQEKSETNISINFPI